jgi:hypothetical protein
VHEQIPGIADCTAMRALTSSNRSATLELGYLAELA